MQRRTLLTLGAGSAALLALAGGGAALWRPGLDGTRLSAPARAVFHAVARAVLDGSLSEDAAARERELQAHLDRLDATLAGFAPAVRGELSLLLALLGAPPGRVTLAGLVADWPAASIAELQTALESMRRSRLTLRQQAYHALRDLTNAAYYAEPATWARLGYPGPVAL